MKVTETKDVDFLDKLKKSKRVSIYKLEKLIVMEWNRDTPIEITVPTYTTSTNSWLLPDSIVNC